VTSTLLLEFCVRNRAIRAQDVNDQNEGVSIWVLGSSGSRSSRHHCTTIFYREFKAPARVL
jgi:hypothetical protein